MVKKRIKTEELIKKKPRLHHPLRIEATLKVNNTYPRILCNYLELRFCLTIFIVKFPHVLLLESTVSYFLRPYVSLYKRFYMKSKKQNRKMKHGIR